MAQTTKQFKIGEYVVGGIIRVNINGKVIQIKFQDWNTKEDIHTGTCLTTDDNARRMIMDFIEKHGTHYYADKVLKWIETKVELKAGSGFFNW